MSKRENQKQGGAHLIPSSWLNPELASREKFFRERKRNEYIEIRVLARMETKLGNGVYSIGRRNYSNVYHLIRDNMVYELVTAERIKSMNDDQIYSYIDECIEHEVKKTIKKALKDKSKIIFKKKETENEYMDFSDVRPPKTKRLFKEFIVIKPYGVTDMFTRTVELSFEDLYNQYEILVEEPTQVDTLRQGGKSRRNKKSRSKQSRKSTQKNRH